MKNLPKITLMTILAVSTIASNAYASGGNQARMAQENFEYFKAQELYNQFLRVLITSF